MDEHDVWYVILEEYESRCKVRHVEGVKEDARRAALEIARTHEQDLRFKSLVREIHQLSEDSWFVAGREKSGWVSWTASFRVSVSRLVEVVEPAPPEEPEPERPGRIKRLMRRD
ncbi:hypothetical protein [Streptomyces sp. NPDC055400]